MQDFIFQKDTNHFEFQELMNNVNDKCWKVISLLNKIDEPEVKSFKNNFERFLADYKNEPKLKIAVIGQYDAGKSSLISAMTNAKFLKSFEEEMDGETKFVDLYKIGEKNIKISSQVMTDTTETYEWDDVLIIDTPGIYAGKQDHDQKTLDTISKADLLVFVISNESFNPQSGNFFRKLVREMKRDGQILLVVNKMSRESGEREVLVETINRVLDPYLTKDYYTCFIDAKSYLDGINEEDDEEKRYLIKKSEFDNFTISINSLIKKNKLTAKIITPLHRIQDTLDRVKISLTITDNKAQKDLLEISRRRILLLQSFKTSLENKLLVELRNHLHDIRMLAEEITVLIDGNHTIEEIEQKDIEIKDKIVAILEKYEQVSNEIINKHKGDIRTKFTDELEKSPVFNSFCTEVVSELKKYSGSIDLKIDIPQLESSIFTKEKLGEIINVLNNTASELIKINEQHLSERAEFYGDIADKLNGLAKLGIAATLFVAAPADPSLLLQGGQAFLNAKQIAEGSNSSSLVATKVMKGGGELSKVAAQGVKHMISLEEAKVARIIKNRTFWEKTAAYFGKGKKISSNIHMLQKSLPIINGIGAVLTIGSTIIEEKKRIDFEKNLAKSRKKIRNNMVEITKEIENEFKENIKELLSVYDVEIDLTKEEENQFNNIKYTSRGFKSEVDTLLKEVEMDIDEINKLS